MKLQQFWLKYYTECNEKGEINIASKNGNPYLWMRKTAEWIYLADPNGDFRAAKADDNLFKVITEWLNGVRADQEKLDDFKHAVIKENVEYNPGEKFWTYKS
jgi:hypothetical protein